MSLHGPAWRRLRGEAGHTLIELVTVCALFPLVLGATLTGLEMFSTTARTTELQNEAQDRARMAMDAMSRELRNVGSADPAQPIGLERAEPADVVFRSVGSYGGATAGRRTRYCLDSSVPANGRLWRQLQEWPGSAPPPAPTGTGCPAPGWDSERVAVDRLTNAARAPAAPVWSFEVGSLSEVTAIRVSLYIDVDPQAPPRESQLSSAVGLRNQNRAPIAKFSATVAGDRHVLLNGSASRDPEGGQLNYVWYRDGVAIGSGLICEYAAPGPGTYEFRLQVSDPSGLQGLSEPQQVTIS